VLAGIDPEALWQMPTSHVSAQDVDTMLESTYDTALLYEHAMALSEREDLGSLPRSVRAHELQTLSLNALRQILPVEGFLIRDERFDDAGVDASLELLIDARYTNMRAQVQLKGTDSTEHNADETVSLSVAISNLNYLLNGPSPLYILYIAPQRQLRYVWAHDERRRLDKENPEWMQQQTVTLRFKERLDGEALTGIRQRIMQEARLHRRLHETLGRAGASEPVIVGVNPQTLASTDPHALADLLSRGGLSLISAGHGTEVLDAIGYLNPSEARGARLRLVRGYAEYTLSQYHAAFATLAQAAVQDAQLTSGDRQFLAYLRDACAFQTGRIDRVEYHRRLAAWAEQGGSTFALDYRLEQLRSAMHEADDAASLAKVISRLRTFVSDIQTHTDMSETFRLHARLTLLYAEGRATTNETLRAMHQVKVRRSMGFSIALDEYEHPLLLGEALLTWVKIMTARAMNGRWLRQSMGTLPMVTEEHESLIVVAQQAVDLYVQAGSLEGELRAKLILADVHMLCDQPEQARLLAQDVQPKAQAMEFTTIARWANDFLTGNTVWDAWRATFDRIAHDDEDFRMAAHTDDEMRAFARDILQSLGLPESRYPVFERESFSLRDIARERLWWCRSIELTQDTRHAASQLTLYSTDPERFAWCRMHNYRSTIGATDWTAVIAAFKQVYCSRCMHRAPKQDDPQA
jgi:hypothetical protein